MDKDNEYEKMVIFEFLEWCENRGLILAWLDDEGDGYSDNNRTYEELFKEYFKE